LLLALFSSTATCGRPFTGSLNEGRQGSPAGNLPDSDSDFSDLAVRLIRKITEH
jgi:hypothetical protein